MLGGEDEEWVGVAIVLVVLDHAEPIGVAVSKKVLRGGMPVVCEVFEQAGGLTDKVVALLDGLLDLNDVGLGLDRNGEGLHGWVLCEGQRRHGGQWHRVGQGQRGGHRCGWHKTEARWRHEGQKRGWRGCGRQGQGGGWRGCGGGTESTQQLG